MHSEIIGLIETEHPSVLRRVDESLSYTGYLLSGITDEKIGKQKKQ